MQTFALDKFIDIKPLEDIHLETCAGIAKAETDLSARVIPHLEMEGNWEELVKFKNAEQDRIASVRDEAESILTPQEREVFDKLTHNQKKRFMQLYKNAYCDGEFVRLRFTKPQYWGGQLDKYATFYSDKCKWSINVIHLPKIVDFVKTLPFEDLGRVLMFVTYAHMPSDLHFDRKDNPFDGRHHFIWFNPFGQKRFFLVNEQGQKEYINSKVCMFDTTKLHGSDPTPMPTYTLRVDGQLTKEFCEKVGLEWQKR